MTYEPLSFEDFASFAPKQKNGAAAFSFWMEVFNTLEKWRQERLCNCFQLTRLTFVTFNCLYNISGYQCPTDVLLSLMYTEHFLTNFQRWILQTPNRMEVERMQDGCKWDGGG